jgi:type I restriction-modification system DNA methylase subunit
MSKKSTKIDVINKEIKSEEDLQKLFDEIHNNIRDYFGFYGKEALHFFLFFFLMKEIEPQIKKGRIHLDINTCAFSKLKELYNNQDDLIKYVIKMRDAVFENDFLYKNIFMPFETATFQSKNTNLSDFLKLIDKLTPEIIEKFHVKGRMYEYFLGHIGKRSSGSKKGGQVADLGQHYSSRHVIRYMIAYLDPELDEDDVPSMIDAFCGSGGFITEYIRYLDWKYDNNIK